MGVKISKNSEKCEKKHKKTLFLIIFLLKYIQNFSLTLFLDRAY
jgi:hypothetical protein